MFRDLVFGGDWDGGRWEQDHGASLFRSLAEAVPHLVWIANGERVVGYVNGRVALYSGLMPNADGTWTWSPIIHPDDQARTVDAWAVGVAGVDSFECEHRIGMADGSYRWHVSRAVAVHSTSNRTLTWFGTTTDVHDQKLVELEMGAREEIIRQMANNLPLPVWVVNANGEFSFVNTAYCEYFGTTEDQVLNGGWRSITHVDDGPVNERKFAEALRERRPFRGLVRVRRADGKWRHLESWAQPNFGAHGRFLGMVGSSADVTDRQLAVAELRQQRDQDRRISVRLQRALLPGSSIHHPDFEISADYQPATDVLEVGGDWYDTFTLQDGRIGLVVGDVVGHNVEAAAAMGQLRSGFLALSVHAEQPGALLSAVDDFVRAHSITGFATASCCLIDPRTGAIAYASAGHVPMLLVPETGPARWLNEALSVPLGLVGSFDRPDATVTMTPGSVLLAFSDGLVERRGENIGQGLERLAMLVESLRSLSASELCRRVVTEMGGSHEDDTVAVCVRRLAPGQRTTR